MLQILMLALVLVLAVRVVFPVVRFARMTPQARKHIPLAVYARFGWRWFCRAQRLAYVDQHRRRSIRPGTGTSVTVLKPADNGTVKLRYPRARIRADEYGITARVKAIPLAGSRQDFQDVSDYLADHWKCVRVQVSQPKPGRVLLRGLRTDPLTEVLPAADVPAAVLGEGVADLRRLQLLLGRDEWASWRHLSLNDTPGITVGGLPGFGKTEFVRWLLRQLDGVPLKLTVIDGKGSFDYDDIADRCWISTGDDLLGAAAALERAHGEMRSRLGSVLDLTGGYRNAWHVGPTKAMPLQLTIIDEAHTFYDLEGNKGDREAEAAIRACRMHTTQLVKKGRSVLCVTVIVTQKQTSDAVPTSIRDVCGAGFSFACRSREGSVSALGETIRNYELYCPTTLQDASYVGVMTARLRTGLDPFVRIRVPRLDVQPAVVTVPDDASALVPAP